MKKLINFLGLLLVAINLSAQVYPCDIASNGLSPSVTSLRPGETIDISFDIYNAGSDPNCRYNPGEITVVLALPPFLKFTSIVSPSMGNGDYFMWTYDEIENVMFGENDAFIGWGQGEGGVTFRFTALVPDVYPSFSPVSFDITSTGISNYNDNDDYAQTIFIVAPLPIELSSFYGKVVDCKYVDLKWETASEQNNAYMEILRSTDGKEFLAIGRVEGSNNARGSSYSLEDHNFLEPGTKYLYKIRQVDFDGTMTHHKLISVQYDCQGAKAEMKLYPNPAMDNVNVTMSGIKLTQDVSFHLYNSEGALVRKLFIASDKVNELSLLGLSPGIYHIKSVNLDEPVYARFIKIE
jgi:Secretion system C-terminal sorting domain